MAKGSDALNATYNAAPPPLADRKSWMDRKPAVWGDPIAVDRRFCAIDWPSTNGTNGAARRRLIVADIEKLLSSPEFWFGGVLVGVLVNLLSGWIQRHLTSDRLRQAVTGLLWLQAATVLLLRASGLPTAQHGWFVDLTLGTAVAGAFWAASFGTKALRVFTLLTPAALLAFLTLRVRRTGHEVTLEALGVVFGFLSVGFGIVILLWIAVLGPTKVRLPGIGDTEKAKKH